MESQNLLTLPTKLQSDLDSLIEFYATNTEPPLGCSKCTEGRIKVAKSFGWDTQLCECYVKQQEVKQQLLALKESNITASELILYSTSEYKQDRLHLEDIIGFALGNLESKWLYLHGGPGTGKTYTGVLAALFSIVSGRSALYVNVPELLDMLRPGREDDGKQWLSMCRKADLLVLDDIGQEKGSAWVSEKLYLIINNRYRECKKTVFTSNFSLDDLQVLPAIISRIKHFSQVVDFKEKDKRISIT